METFDSFRKTDGGSGQDSQENLSPDQVYGKLFLDLLDQGKRDRAYGNMEKLLPRYPEAGIALGQYYQGSDRNRARSFFKTAADANIAEGQWGYAGLLPHGAIPDFSRPEDREWLKYALAAAEGGCPDAANEMGNICHRKGCFAESAYWYGMAYVLEHPSGMTGLRGITMKWQQSGSPAAYKACTENYTESRHETALLLFKIFNRFGSDDLNSLTVLTLGGENLAGFIAALLYEQHHQDQMAYQMYNALCFDGHPHALRCYANMLAAGKGCPRDLAAAFRFYLQAAEKGNAPSMFVMGEKARQEGDRYLAASWYGKAYLRGFQMAANRLSQLA